MRIHIVNGQFNMGRLLFTEASTSSFNELEESTQIFISPTIPDQRIFVKNINSEHQFFISDLMGRKVKTGTIRPESFISIEELPPGFYLLILDGTEKLNFIIVE